MWKTFEASDYAESSFRKGYGNDYPTCNGMFRELHDKYNDPFVNYAVASHCMHLEPAYPGGHTSVAYSLGDLSRPLYPGLPMPGVIEQSQLEAEVAYQFNAHLLEHPEVGHPSDTRETTTKAIALCKWMSGHSLQGMHKYAEARAAYQRSLALNPNFTPAQHDLASLPH